MDEALKDEYTAAICADCKGPCEARPGERHCASCGRLSYGFRCHDCQRRVDEAYEAQIAPMREAEETRLRDLAIEQRVKDLVGMGHTERTARKMAKEALSSIVPDVGTFIPVNEGAHDAIERRARELQRDEGLEYRDAMQIASNERGPQYIMDDPPERRPRDEYLGGSIESIGFDRKAVGGGGSKSGRRRTKKKGTWICGDCKLEYCDHRPKAGRKRKESEVREIKLRVHVTQATHDTIMALGLSLDDALAAFAIAVREMRPLDDVLEEWRKMYPVKAKDEISVGPQ